MGDLVRELARALMPELRAIQGREFGIGEKHDASGTPISYGYNHGPGGLLTFPGIDPDIYQTIVGCQGILGQLATKPSRYAYPTYYTLTGVRDVTGTEKVDVCDNARTAGLLKGCMINSVFGRYELATSELELNRLGLLNDRADPMDLRMVGSPIHASGLFTQGIGSAAEPADLLSNEISRKFWELGIAYHRLLCQQLWTGDPSNNSAGGGYKELTGFSVLVNTGHVDAETNTSCPSMDSDVKNFNYQRVDTNGPALVDALAYMYRYVKSLAFRTGVNPVRWVLAMREELFYEMTAIWPCNYLTYRCSLTGNSELQVLASDAVKFRDDMRAGKYLLIDGDRVEVVLDDGITELNGNNGGGNFPNGCFSSDIYLIPMSVVGGQAVTYLEYFDYDNPSLQSALQGGNMILAKNNGPYLFWPRQTNQCVVWQAKIEPRLVLRTPWLAGRLQNVVYCPTQHTRQPFPDDPYFVNGGRDNRVAQGPSYYNMWSS